MINDSKKCHSFNPIKYKIIEEFVGSYPLSITLTSIVLNVSSNKTLFWSMYFIRGGTIDISKPTHIVD